MSLGKVIKLSSGHTIPQIGFGTWLAKPGEVKQAVEWAVEAGYRHIDCAKIYNNQDEVGAALKNVIPRVCKREDLFITSKLWNNSHRPENVRPALEQTLQELGLDYLDLYLIHWPVCMLPGRELEPTDDGKWALLEDVPLADTWRAMIALRDAGKVRSIGVSNFRADLVEGVAAATGVRPAVLQIEAHPRLPQDALVAYCKKNDIHITAYSPLGNNLTGETKIVDYPEVKAIAEKIGATPAQVLIAWGAHRGYSVIPKSVHKERVYANFKQVELSAADYDTVSALGAGDRRRRFNIPFKYTPVAWDINIFDEEVEQDATTRPRVA